MTTVQETALARSVRRPLWLSILAIFSLLLGIITAIPQFYYVLFGLHSLPSALTATFWVKSGTAIF